MKDMEMHYEACEPMLSWLYAGPYILDVSDRYMDNYRVPFEPYANFWQEALSRIENEMDIQECAPCQLWGEEKPWRLFSANAADKQLTWARFGTHATLMATLGFTSLRVERAGTYPLHVKFSGSLCLWINGRVIFCHTRVGRVTSEEVLNVSLKDGWNAVKIVLMNVHLHCLNTLQLLLSAPCSVQLALAPLDDSLRQAVERAFQSFSLSDSVLLPNESIRLLGEDLPETGAFYYALAAPDGKRCAQGQIPAPQPNFLLARHDALAQSGGYAVDLWYEKGGVKLSGPSLAFRRVALWQDVPETDLEGRKRFLLEKFAQSARDGNERNGIFAQLAVLAAGHAKDFDEAMILRTLDYIDARFDCADFAMHGVLRFYFLYAQHPAVSEELRARLCSTILNFKYWVDEAGKSLMFTRSENHEMLFYSAEYLAGLAFPTDVFPNSAQNGLFHAQKGQANALRWIREKGYYGFTEWHSNTYYEEDMLALVNLYDFAEENGLLRQLARQLLDFIAILIASNSSKGIMGTTHGRCYEAALMHPVTESMSRINWLLFGQPRRLIQDISIGAIALATSSYAPPAASLALTSEQTPLETITRMGLFRREMQHGVICSTYRTAHYMVSGLIESKAGEHGAQVNAGQILLEGDVPIFATCFADRSSITRPSYWGGQHRIPRTVACRNVLAYVYHIEESLGYSHCYFPMEQMDEVHRTEKWLFARRGGAYVALHCNQPYIQIASGAYRNRELFSFAKDVTWLLEAGDCDEWHSFEAFVNAISAAFLCDEPDGLHYRSPTTGDFSLCWTECTRNGNPIAREDVPLIENPLVYAQYGSGKIFLPGGHVMDFFA